MLIPWLGLTEADANKMVSQFKLSQDDAAKFASILTILYKAALNMMPNWSS